MGRQALCGAANWMIPIQKMRECQISRGPKTKMVLLKDVPDFIRDFSSRVSLTVRQRFISAFRELIQTGASSSISFSPFYPTLSKRAVSSSEEEDIVEDSVDEEEEEEEGGAAAGGGGGEAAAASSSSASLPPPLLPAASAPEAAVLGAEDTAAGAGAAIGGGEDSAAAAGAPSAPTPAQAGVEVRVVLRKPLQMQYATRTERRILASPVGSSGRVSAVVQLYPKKVSTIYFFGGQLRPITQSIQLYKLPGREEDYIRCSSLIQDHLIFEGATQQRASEVRRRLVALAFVLHIMMMP